MQQPARRGRFEPAVAPSSPGALHGGGGGGGGGTVRSVGYALAGAAAALLVVLLTRSGGPTTLAAGAPPHAAVADGGGHALVAAGGGAAAAATWEGCAPLCEAHVEPCEACPEVQPQPRIRSRPSPCPPVAPPAPACAACPAAAAPPAAAPAVAVCPAPAPCEACPACPALAPPAPPLPCPAPAGDAPATTTTGGAACHLVFKSYTPSTFEAAWGVSGQGWASSRAVASPICDRLNQPDQRELMQRWIDVGEAVMAARLGRGAGGLGPRDSHPQFEAARAAAAAGRPHDVFSVFTYADSCSGALVHTVLEPLAGLLRDPRPICPQYPFAPPVSSNQWKATTLFDPRFTDALLKSVAGAAGRAAPRVYLFDVGATGYDPVDPAYGSIKWLEATFGALGVEFDEVFAWEYTESPRTTFFNGASTRMVAKIHFYNFGANTANTFDNPLEILRAVARPEDLVVLKLDIDNAPIEGELMRQLLTDASLTGLVDMLWHEDHVAMPEMEPYWGGGLPRSWSDSWRMFSEARHKGIRMSTWP